VDTGRIRRDGPVIAFALPHRPGAAIAGAHADRRPGHGQRGDGFTSAPAKSGPVRADARRARPVRGPDADGAVGNSFCRSLLGSRRRAGAVGGAIRQDAVGKTVVGADRPKDSGRVFEGGICGACAVAGAIPSRVIGASRHRGAIPAGGGQPGVIWAGTIRAGAIRLRAHRALRAAWAVLDGRVGLGPVRSAHWPSRTIRADLGRTALFSSFSRRAGPAGRRSCADRESAVGAGTGIGASGGGRSAAGRSASRADRLCRADGVPGKKAGQEDREQAHLQATRAL